MLKRLDTDILKDQAPFIYEIAKIRSEFCLQTTLSHSFIWSDTKEGQELWSEVSRGIFSNFYKFYGRNELTGNLD